MPNTTVDPAADKLPVFNADQNRVDEATVYAVVEKVIAAGTNVSLTKNSGTGKVTINASGGSGGGDGTVSVTAPITGNGSSANPLGVAQATEAARGSARIITQANADAGVNDIDILTIKKLLALGGPALAAAKALFGDASGFAYLSALTDPGGQTYMKYPTNPDNAKWHMAIGTYTDVVTYSIPDGSGGTISSIDVSHTRVYINVFPPGTNLAQVNDPSGGNAHPSTRLQPFWFEF